jgi:endoribonuclease LACTB2
MPTSPLPISIVNVGHRSTNYWVVSAGRSRLLVDAGWPGRFDALRTELERKDVPLSEVRCAFATHFHIDHAGAAEDLKRAGIPLLVVDLQVPFIAAMAAHVKPGDRYTPITAQGNTVITLDDSRPFLASLGIAGSLVHTPGHSDDSVSLLLDDGSVFTGDLTHPSMIGDAERDVTEASWERLRALGATTVYGGHGPVWRL